MLTVCKKAVVVCKVYYNVIRISSSSTVVLHECFSTSTTRPYRVHRRDLLASRWTYFYFLLLDGLTSCSKRSQERLDGLDGGRTREHGAQSLHTVTTTPINIITIHDLIDDIVVRTCDGPSTFVCGHVTVT